MSMQVSARRRCRTCSARRVVCDGGEPVCRKCEERGLLCRKAGQYRVRFQEDQTWKKRFLQKTATSFAAKTSLAYSRNVPLPEMARMLFQQQSPLILRGSGARDPLLSFLPAMLKNVPAKSPVWIAIESVALASLSTSQRRPEVEAMALRSNNRVLRRLRQDLSPTGAASPPTPEIMVTIFLLCLYGFITSSEPRSSMFLQHLAGLRNQLGRCDLRAFIQLPGGVEFLNALRLQTISLSLITSVTMPPLTVPDGWCLGLDDSNVSRLQRWLLEVVELRATSAVVLPSSALIAEDTLRRLVSIVHAAKNLYQDAQGSASEWANDPSISPSRVVGLASECVKDNVEVMDIWPGEVFVYRDLTACSLHSCLLIGRLSCACIIIRHLGQIAQLDRRSWMVHTSEIRAYSNMMRNDINEVCAMIPFSFGLDPLAPCSDSAPLPPELLRGGGALYMWNPLLFALSVEGIPELQRQWIRGRLKYLGERIGVGVGTLWSQVVSPHLVLGTVRDRNDVFQSVSGWHLMRQMSPSRPLTPQVPEAQLQSIAVDRAAPESNPANDQIPVRKEDQASQYLNAYLHHAKAPVC